jgi:hypothetical protein
MQLAEKSWATCGEIMAKTKTKTKGRRSGLQTADKPLALAGGF